MRGDINGDVGGIIKGDVTGIINGYVTGSVEGKVGGGISSLHQQKKTYSTKSDYIEVEDTRIQNENVDNLLSARSFEKLEAIYISHCKRIESMKVKDVKAEIKRLNLNLISTVGLGAELKENLMLYYEGRMLIELIN